MRPKDPQSPVRDLSVTAIRPLDEILRLVDAVRPEDTADVGARFLAPELMTAVRLGPTS